MNHYSNMSFIKNKVPPPKTRGKWVKIKSMQRLFEIADMASSVYVIAWRRRSPAAFFLSWQARMLDNWVKNGQFYE